MWSVGQLAMSSSKDTVRPLMTTRHNTPSRVSPIVRPHPHPPESDTATTVASPIQLALSTVDPDVGVEGFVAKDAPSLGPAMDSESLPQATSERRTRGIHERIISASDYLQCMAVSTRAPLAPFAPLA